MVFMLQRKLENFDAGFDDFSAEFPFLKLYQAYGYSSLGAEDKNEDYFKKSLLILKDFNEHKNLHSETITRDMQPRARQQHFRLN